MEQRKDIIAVKSKIADMVDHQRWVKMHVDVRLDSRDAGVPYARFVNMVKGILPTEKQEMFFCLLRFPLPTVPIASAVFDKLSRIFEGRNGVRNYQFRKKQLRDDWEWYRQERLNEPDVWRDRAWEFFKTEPNSVLVVDMPENGRSDMEDRYVQPYFYWVLCEDIVDFDCDPDGKFNYFVFRDRRTGRTVRIDDKSYSYYSKGRAWDEQGAVPDGRSEHGLGYCPCKWFVEDSLSIEKPWVKASPITKALSALDHYLWSDTSKKYLDAYGSYPIYSGYQFSCNYRDEMTINGEKTNVHCDHGMLVDEDGYAVNHEGKPAKCPSCGGGSFIGAGSVAWVPTPDEAEGHDLRNPIQMLTVDRDALDYSSENLSKQKSGIISMCVGVDGEAINEFSVSDKQVDANFETQSTILLRVKRNFERAQKFVDETICRLRYGKEFEGCTIDYGTEFYTLSTQELRKRYTEAKNGGAPESDLLALRQQIIETEYRNDPLTMQRMLILLDVEPLLGMTSEEARSGYTAGLLDYDDVKVKINFESLIRRFERENGNIIDYGLVGLPAMDYKQKIESIKSKLYDYVKEIKPRSTLPGTGE